MSKRLHNSNRILRFTVAEQEAWDALGEAAKLIMHLPEDHPKDRHDYMHLLHALQNAILARPTYRESLHVERTGG